MPDGKPCVQFIAWSPRVLSCNSTHLMGVPRRVHLVNMSIRYSLSFDMHIETSTTRRYTTARRSRGRERPCHASLLVETVKQFLTHASVCLLRGATHQSVGHGTVQDTSISELTNSARPRNFAAPDHSADGRTARPQMAPPSVQLLKSSTRAFRRYPDRQETRTWRRTAAADALEHALRCAPISDH